MRSFKTFLAEQRQPIRPSGRLPRFPMAGRMFKGQTPRGTAAGAVDLLTRQPYKAIGKQIKQRTGLNVPVRGAVAGTVGGAGVSKSLDVLKREVNKYLRSQGLEAGRYTPEFDMPQPEFEPERQVPVPDYKEPRKAFGRTVPGINKAQEGPDTLGKFELLNISRKALGSTPGEQAKNLGRVLTTQQGLEYAGPAAMDTALMFAQPAGPATAGTLAPESWLELRRRGTRAATKAFTALTGKKPAQIYSPYPTEADIQATQDFDKLRQAWLKAGREKESKRLGTSAPKPSTEVPTAPSGDIDLDALLDF